MRTVLITGASTGFGQGTALALARSGWRVFASMRDLAKAEPLLATNGECMNTVIPLALDVTDPASVEAAVAEVLCQTGGTLDALVNNAGYSVLGAFEDLDEAACRAQMETNFFGVLAVTRAVLPAMRKAGKGRILAITSNAVNSPHPLLSMYAASKWALEGWAEGLAMEVAPFGIEVAVLQSGAHRTPFASNVQFVQPEGSPYQAWLAEAMPGIGNLDRWGRDPALAVAAIVAAVTEDKVPFRQAIGEDSQVFSSLKGMAPYETRAWLLRQIAGIPGPNSLRPDGTSSSVIPASVFDEVVNTVLSAALKDAGTSGVLAQTFGL